MLQTGMLLDNRYKILGVLGRGGTSCVYLAENIRIRKTWAIKEVYKQGMDQAVTVQNGLITETAILTKLRHPCLPIIVDVIDTPRSYYVIMEYIEGKPLNKVLAQGGAQPEAVVLKWARQLCGVLHYLHEQKPPIIYRDMKPANIMLKPDGGITLIDFGTAREFKHTRDRDTVHLGTHGYAAPEQYSSTVQSDARTDIYCLGVTLYHLVTGHDPSLPPYGLRPIRQINASLSVKLERIIQKCTQLNPADRYQSTDELMRDLEDPQPAREYIFDEDFEPKKQRSMIWLIALIPAFFVIIGVVMAVALSRPPPASSAPPTTPLTSPVRTPYNGLVDGRIYDAQDVWLSGEDDYAIYEYFPQYDGVYHFFSRSDDVVPVVWLSDEYNDTLCDSNTYGTNNEFDFSYRLSAGQIYYLQVALYTLDDSPKAGYFTVYVVFSND